MVLDIFGDSFLQLISDQIWKFSEFNPEISILFQIKVFGKIIEEISLERYLIKVTLYRSFTRLRIIRRITGFISIKQKTFCQDSVLSPSNLSYLKSIVSKVLQRCFGF